MIEKQFESKPELCEILMENKLCDCDCTKCFINANSKFELNGSIRFKEKITVRKVYFLGKDNNIYHWYVNKKTHGQPMPETLTNYLDKFAKERYEYLRTDWFEIEKDKIKLLTIYKNNEEIEND